MAYTGWTEKDEVKVASKKAAPVARRKVFQPKPEELDREQFRQLHLDVAKRIPKTLAILAE